MTTAVQLAQSVAPGVSLGFKNRLINGGMTIDQRNAGASVTPGSTLTYTLDRWRAYLSQGAKFSVQQNAGSVTPPVGFTNYLGITSLSAYSVGASEIFTINQFIEGYNVADLGWGTANAKPITLSFWVRSSLTGTFGGSFNSNGQARSYAFSYTISAANTWEYKTVTIAGDTTGTWETTNGRGLEVWFSVGSGSSVSTTTGSWVTGSYYSATGATSVVGTNGATWYITGVQLEVGTAATSFEFRDYGRELAMCQRYYQKYAGVTGDSPIFAFAMWSAGSGYAVFKYQPMRAAPSFSYRSLSDFTVYCGGATASPSSLNMSSGASTELAEISFSGASFSSGQAAWMRGSAVSYVALSAEL